MLRPSGHSPRVMHGRMRSVLATLMATSLVLVFAGLAVAHTPKVSLTCDAGLKVNLADYNASHDNTVAVSIDGAAVVGSPFTFRASFSQTWSGLSLTVPHAATVAVTAWDDPNGANSWTKTFDLPLPACQKATPTPTATVAPSATAAPSEEPTDTPSQEPTATPMASQEPTATPSQEPTATPTEEPTATPTEQPTATPTEQPTATPTEEPTPTPSAVVGGATGTPTPSGTVEAATGKPGPTPPSTDSIGTTGSDSSGGLPIVLLALAGILATTLILTPRRRNNR